MGRRRQLDPLKVAADRKTPGLERLPELNVLPGMKDHYFIWIACQLRTVRRSLEQRPLVRPTRAGLGARREVICGPMSEGLRTFEEILEAARRLPEPEQHRLADELGNGHEAPPEERRRDALKRWRARAGTGHSDLTDVSENKNKHLADIYATKP